MAKDGQRIVCPNCGENEISIYVMLGGIVKHQGELQLLQTSMEDEDAYIPISRIPWIVYEQGECSECEYKGRVSDFIIFVDEELTKFDIALTVLELGHGLTKQNIKDLLRKLPDDTETTFVNFSEDGMLAMGIASLNKVNELGITQSKLNSIISQVISDIAKENVDEMCITLEGLRIYADHRLYLSIGR